MNYIYSIAIILVIAIVTIFTRTAAFAVFGGNRKVPKLISYLGAVMPAAVISMLIIYCIRSTDFMALSSVLPIIIASIATAIIHFKVNNTLLSIFTGTVLYMVLIQSF